MERNHPKETTLITTTSTIPSTTNQNTKKAQTEVGDRPSPDVTDLAELPLRLLSTKMEMVMLKAEAAQMLQLLHQLNQKLQRRKIRMITNRVRPILHHRLHRPQQRQLKGPSIARLPLHQHSHQRELLLLHS